ncbi:MAG TPA: helix-turn-helix transcriptional regulator [Elusimicrobiales bacterium]|nr:helix-turn-helix transcriptional regulator [Elusimicrobiales bacterium]
MTKQYSVADRYILKKIGKNIRVFRKQINFSQEDLAFKASIDRSYVGSLERGEKNVSVLTLNRVAKALNVSLDTFLKI